MAARKKKTTRKKGVRKTSKPKKSARNTAKPKKNTKKKTTRKRKASAPKPRPSKKSKKGTEGGRPAIEFDKASVRAIGIMAAAGNTIEDVARTLTVSKSTLERRIADESHPIHDVWHRALAVRHNSLRVMQWKNARSGNCTMQIFLGKNELGQRDFRAIEVSGHDGGPIQTDGGDMLALLFTKMKAWKRSKRTPDVDLPAD